MTHWVYIVRFPDQSDYAGTSSVAGVLGRR